MIKLLLFHSAAFHRSSSSSRFDILASFHWTDFLLCAMKLPLQTSVCSERLRFLPNFFDGSRTLFSNFFSRLFWFFANSHLEYAAPFLSFRAAKSSHSGVAEWSLVCRVCSTHYKFSVYHMLHLHWLLQLQFRPALDWANLQLLAASSTAFEVAQTPTICCVSTSIAKCSLRHVRLLLQPCVRTFHSPSPYTFTPVESIHKCNFSLKFRNGNFTSNDDNRRQSVV